MGNVCVSLINPWVLAALTTSWFHSWLWKEYSEVAYAPELRLFINTYVIDQLGDHPGYQVHVHIKRRFHLPGLFLFRF